jgi:hypothetical protein
MEVAMDDLQLVLVDLDNVRGEDSGPLDALWPAHLPRAEHNDDAPPCVVVYAMNLETADHHVTFEGLRTLAEHLAVAIGRSSLQGIETALTLPVKESADVALERLLVHAATGAHNGRLVAVHLLSDDRGLRQNVADYLGKKYRERPADGVTSWSFTGKKKAVSRRAPKPGIHALGEANPAHPHLALDAPEHIVQLGRNYADIAPDASLQDVAVSASNRPGLLTQLGITEATVRGVERLGQLADGERPRLSPLTYLDGVEFCRDSVPGGDYSAPKVSTLGPGAVRFDDPPGTLSTRLPTSLVLAAKGPLPASAGRLDDRAILERLDNADLHGGETIRVSLSSDGRMLKAEVHRAFRSPLAAWWRTSTKTESKLRCGGSLLSLRSTLEAAARCAIDRPDGSVFLQAPFNGSVWATIEPGADDIVRGTVEGVPVACLLPPSHTSPRARVTPIQRISSTSFKQRFAKHFKHFRYLRRLPLMVSA